MLFFIFKNNCTGPESRVGRFRPIERGYQTEEAESLPGITDIESGRYSQLPPETVKLTSPAGGQSIWIELPNEFGSREVYLEAAKRGISILPGFLCTSLDTFDQIYTDQFWWLLG